MWTRARIYDLIFVIAWPLVVLAFWDFAAPQHLAILEGSRIALATLMFYLWGVAGRRRE